MSSTLGEIAISAMCMFFNRDQQDAAITKFIQNELLAERNEVALIQQQGS